MPLVPVDSNQETDPRKECTKGEKLFCSGLIIFIVFVFGIGVIRFYTEVVPSQYYWPCNNTDILPSIEIKILEEENRAYNRIIHEYEQKERYKYSAELKNVKTKKREIEKRIKQQDCFRQKCAKINIQINLEEIKDKASTISTWLFRIAAVLLLLFGILCYHERKLFCKEFGIFVFIFVAPIFVNAFISLYDYFAMSNFTVNC